MQPHRKRRLVRSNHQRHGPDRPHHLGRDSPAPHRLPQDPIQGNQIRRHRRIRRPLQGQRAHRIHRSLDRLRSHRQQLRPRHLHAGRPQHAARAAEPQQRTVAYPAPRRPRIRPQQILHRPLQHALLQQATRQRENRTRRLRAVLLSARQPAPLEPHVRQERPPAIPMRVAVGRRQPDGHHQYPESHHRLRPRIVPRRHQGLRRRALTRNALFPRAGHHPRARFPHPRRSQLRPAPSSRKHHAGARRPHVSRERRAHDRRPVPGLLSAVAVFRKVHRSVIRLGILAKGHNPWLTLPNRATSLSSALPQLSPSASCARSPNREPAFISSPATPKNSKLSQATSKRAEHPQSSLVSWTSTTPPCTKRCSPKQPGNWKPSTSPSSPTASSAIRNTTRPASPQPKPSCTQTSSPPSRSSHGSPTTSSQRIRGRSPSSPPSPEIAVARATTSTEHRKARSTSSSKASATASTAVAYMCSPSSPDSSPRP